MPGTNIQAVTYEQLTGETVTWTEGPTVTAYPFWPSFEVMADEGEELTFRRRAQDTAGLWSEWENLSVTVTYGVFGVLGNEIAAVFNDLVTMESVVGVAGMRARRR
jgi:hypothetical protein